MKWNMTVHGGDELARALRAMPDATTGKVMGEALKAGGEPIRATAASLIKRGTTAPHVADHVGMQLGRSKHSLIIGPTITRGDDRRSGIPDFLYWLIHEYGTAIHEAQPAMRPAFDRQSGQALGIIGRKLWDSIRKQAGQSGAGSSSGFGGQGLL